jgi:hypothetical protein
MARLFVESVVVDFERFDWLDRLDDDIILGAGERAPKSIEVPIKDAQEIVHLVTRLVLDLPRNTTPQVVWSLGDSELLVHSDKTKIACSSGVVTITAQVECDQCEPVQIPVPLGVGTRKAPGGLVMTTFTDLEGPREIVEVWSDAINAFAWETLIEVARVIAAQVGKDSRGRALVPGSIGAAPGKLLIQPVARHTLKVNI